MAFNCPLCGQHNTRVEKTEVSDVETDEIRIVYTKRRIYCWVCELYFLDTEEKATRIARKGRSR